MKSYVLSILLIAALPFPALAQITVPGANGSDGAFNPDANVEINLGLAPAGAWDAISPTPGRGVYDADKWAVVFHYTSVNIPSGVTVTFKNNATRAPVVWLVQGDVTIGGVVSLDGADGVLASTALALAEPGPGGFRGGSGFYGNVQIQSGGFGPGGARNTPNNWAPPGGSFGSQGSQGSHSSSTGPTYGNTQLLPLMGGSGGAGFLYATPPSSPRGGGGAGGGAILIACQQSLTLSAGGQLRANGGTGYLTGIGEITSGGSGGGVRLIADAINAGGQIRAVGGSSSGTISGGYGRIRMEANTIATGIDSNPPFYHDPVGTTATVWPTAAAPTVTITYIGTQAVSADPKSNLDLSYADVALNTTAPTIIKVQCTNVPVPPAGSSVRIRIVPRSGEDTNNITATYVSGDINQSIWQTTQIQFPNGIAAVQARAILPP